MAFFRNDCFLYSICFFLLSLCTGAPVICRAQEPDHVLPRLILAGKPEWKIRLLYGHGAAVSHKISDLPGKWKKGAYGEPYFLDLDGMSDDVLYQKVDHAATFLSIPFMRIKAFMLWHGRGAKRNTAQAVQLWKTAANAGDETSMDLFRRLPRTPDESVYTRRYLALKRGRLGSKYGKDLFVPHIYFVPEHPISMIKLEKEESVAAFLKRAVSQWQQGKEVHILLAPED